MNSQMQNYRQYPQAQARPPAARRPGQVPHNAQYAAQQAQIQSQQAQQQRAIQEHQLAQRRARKPTDKNLPEDVEDLVIGESVQQYKDLLEAERTLDYTMMRKRMDLQDTLNRTVKRQKTMRVWITNTAENQPWQASLTENAFDFGSNTEATYRVKIEGRLLEDPEDDIFASDDENEDDSEDGMEREKEPKQSKKPAQHMTHFFKSMNVEFDRSKSGSVDQPPQVEWKKQTGGADIDQISFTRRGDENQNIVVNFVRDEQPERFRLSHALSHTLDMEEADRAEAVMGIWDYVKIMGLQEDEEKRSIRCDDSLRQIFGREQVYFPQIPDMIMQHLHPLPPIKLPYTIRVDQEFLSNPEPTIYDIRVSVDDPIRTKIMSVLQNPAYGAQLREIASLDDQLALIVQAIAHSKAKHQFYKNMAKDPAGFVRKWLSSQRRDLEVILGEAARGGGEDGMGMEFQRGGQGSVWDSELAREAVRYMLAKPAPIKPSS